MHNLATPKIKAAAGLAEGVDCVPPPYPTARPKIISGNSVVKNKSPLARVSFALLYLTK